MDKNLFTPTAIVMILLKEVLATCTNQPPSYLQVVEISRKYICS